MGRIRTAIWRLAACSALGSCCESGVHSVGVSLRPLVAVLPSYVWLGDSFTVSATAGTEPQAPCGRLLYTSADEPELFTYHSADTTVATLDAHGLLSARALGMTTVTATSAGVVSGPLQVIVVPQVAALHVTGPSSSPVVGDTVTVRIDAIDSVGAPVPGAQVSFTLGRPLDSIAVFVSPPKSAYPYTTVSAPVTLRLRALRSGVTKLFISAPHEVPGTRRDLADSLIVAVAPRSAAGR